MAGALWGWVGAFDCGADGVSVGHTPGHGLSVAGVWPAGLSGREAAQGRWRRWRSGSAAGDLFGREELVGSAAGVGSAECRGDGGWEVLLPLGACGILLDADTHGREDSSGSGEKPAVNLVSSLLALNVERDPQELLARLGRMALSLRTRLRPDAASVAIVELVDWAAVCMADVMPPEMAVRARRTLLQEENENMMALARTAQEWKRAWLAEGHAKGQADERARGRAALLRVLWAQLVTKFGEDAAATAMARLEGVSETETLARVGEWIADCDSVAELLGRLERIPKRP